MESNRQVALKLNHNNEPRKTSTGSRTPQEWVKAEGRRLPRTTEGPSGGPPGPQGPEGPQGPPGEVSTQQLNDAVATTALNPSSVGPFTGSFSDPPTQAELQDFAAYVETLRVALVR